MFKYTCLPSGYCNSPGVLPIEYRSSGGEGSGSAIQGGNGSVRGEGWVSLYWGGGSGPVGGRGNIHCT